mgnify:FL=1
MPQFKSSFLINAQQRGFIYQCTDLVNLDKLLCEKSVSAYIGFDCTAPSLHAGSLISIMLLRLLQACGHKPIILMGGGTTKIGDPSGKEESRKLIDQRTINKNMRDIKKNFSSFLKFGDGPTDATIINNADWLDKLKYIPFLRDYGQHFSINRMINFDSVKLRLKRQQALSFLEFNYMIFQAYDFLELSRRMDCQLQMGGSDQWGNIVNGIELSRRIDNREIFGLTTPLLTSASGVKMGKTAAGAIWLNKELFSSFDYWQYWRNAEDKDVFKFFKLFTDLSLEKIEEIEKDSLISINDAKKLLATEITKLCHGEKEAQACKLSAESIFEEEGNVSKLPRVTFSKNRLKKGVPAFLLFKEVGLVSSGAEARRLIKGGGGKINDQLINEETQLITIAALDTDGFLKLSAGKKRHLLIELN